MPELLSACGLRCDTCEFYGQTCAGCHAVKGRPFWTADHLAGNPCPLYACAVETKGLPSCGPCSELPCPKFQELKDPRISDEEHLKGTQERAARLRESRGH